MYSSLKLFERHICCCFHITRKAKELIFARKYPPNVLKKDRGKSENKIAKIRHCGPASCHMRVKVCSRSLTHNSLTLSPSAVVSWRKFLTWESSEVDIIRTSFSSKWTRTAGFTKKIEEIYPKITQWNRKNIFTNTFYPNIQFDGGVFDCVS